MRSAMMAVVMVVTLGVAPAAAEGTPAAAPSAAALAKPADVCAWYLAMREELAPTTVLRGDELKARLEELRGSEVELAGRVVGMACCAVEQEGEEARRLVTLELDDGTAVPVSAAAGVDELRIGEEVCVIARVSPSASSAGGLELRSWVREWELPEDQRVHKASVAEAEEPASEHPRTPTPAPGGTSRTRPAEHASREPDEGGNLEAWRSYVLEKNPRLTQGQAELIVKWVLHYSKESRVNHRLVFAVIRWESDFHPECVSHAGAIGLMQLMPGTARYLGVDPWNVQQNIKGGVRYLAEQLADYRGRSNYEQCVLALAAYNAGPNAVKRAGGVPNIAETQRYVKKVTETFHQLWKSGLP